MERNNRKRGFTLVELIVVLVILAVLAALLVPSLRSVYKELHADHETGAVDNK